MMKFLVFVYYRKSPEPTLGKRDHTRGQDRGQAVRESGHGEPVAPVAEQRVRLLLTIPAVRCLSRDLRELRTFLRRRKSNFFLIYFVTWQRLAKNSI